MEAQGLEMVGIYHSHPHGPDSPSPTDIAEAYYPDAVYLIWFRQDGEWAATYRQEDRSISGQYRDIRWPGLTGKRNEFAANVFL
jgi:proteasome lid subunit RPN8/RPN11